MRHSSSFCHMFHVQIIGSNEYSHRKFICSFVVVIKTCNYKETFWALCMLLRFTVEWSPLKKKYAAFIIRLHTKESRYEWITIEWKKNACGDFWWFYDISHILKLACISVSNMFPISCGVFSIYSLFTGTGKTFSFHYDEWEKHFLCILMLLRYFNHNEIDTHYWGCGKWGYRTHFL